MGSYSVPDEIRKLKPVGTNVKKIKGKYYVYSHSQSKDPVTGKWKTNPGKLLGKIVPGIGYVPRKETIAKKETTVFEYGEYLLACRLAKAELELLKQCFTPEDAFQIFALACVFKFEGFIGFSSAESIYKRCLIARDYPDLKFSYHRLHKLLSAVGRSEAVYKFSQKCLKQTQTIAVDGHVIPADSNESDLSYNGYKNRIVKGEQMNLLVALDVDTHLPMATRVFPGYMVDKSDFLEFVKPLGNIEKKLFLMDKGFYSADNLEYLINANADYIMPLSSGLKTYKEAVKPCKGRMAQFLYSDKKKTDFVTYHEITASNGRRTIFFKNMSEREKLLKEYMSKLAEGAKGYTIQGLEEGEKNFGVIVLETSLTSESKSAEEIYKYYKQRWAIETYYDRIKNSINFSELNLSEYGLIQGIAFVMMITGRIDQRILDVSKRLKMNSTYLVRIMSALKLFDNGKSASVCNTKKEHLEIANALDLSFDTSAKCLD